LNSRDSSWAHHRSSSDTAKVEETTFLVDMNKVFEAFVVIALLDTLGLDHHTFLQGTGHHDLRLDRGRHVRLRPDISWWDGRQCVFVGDVKYKRVNIAGYHHPDLYQLLAYTIASDLPGGGC
jgi:5-methylcytosine-specific restriction enzyme subunit McrC